MSFLVKIYSNGSQKNKDMLDKLMDKLLTGVISDEVYAEKQTELIAKRNHLKASMEELKQVSTKFTEIAENLIELCKEAPHLYLRASNDEKKQLLKLLISNSVIDSKKPLVVLNPVFENIQKMVNVKYGGDEGSRTPVRNGMQQTSTSVGAFYLILARKASIT